MNFSSTDSVQDVLPFEASINLEIGNAGMALFAKRYEYERAEILMDFDLQENFGGASVAWSTVNESSCLPQPLGRIALVAMLYGRTLSNHAPARNGLFDRIEYSAQQLERGADTLEVDDWYIRVGGDSYQI